MNGWAISTRNPRGSPSSLETIASGQGRVVELEKDLRKMRTKKKLAAALGSVSGSVSGSASGSVGFS
tara:strand:+ start:167 stop:367 length:201 start_codon:yes stop_codon:yes gene_type:complete